MNAYGEKISSSFSQMNELNLLKQEKAYKKFKKKQQKLNLYIKLITPNKHQNKICKKLGNNTTVTQKTTQSQNGSTTPDTTS